jgi:hypothetical protein
MCQSIADRARVECDAVVVVNKAWELAPWANALAANDHRWWRANPEAKKFAGRKFSANKIDGVEQVEATHVRRESSSGVLALEVARQIGGTVIELHGFENHGDHYFGRYEEPLRNTTPSRYTIFADQLAALGFDLKKAGIRVINRTPDSALKCFDHA